MTSTVNAAGQRIWHGKTHDILYLKPGLPLQVHSRDMCIGENCCIHNPSEHPMVTFPLWWRSDNGLMERTCPHGIGHPDPDALAHMRTMLGEKRYRMRVYEVDGCDLCCSPDAVFSMDATPLRGIIDTAVKTMDDKVRTAAEKQVDKQTLIIDKLVAGMQAHDFLEEHANDFLTGSWEERCMPCSRYVAALLRGARPVDAVKLACEERQQADEAIAVARRTVEQWLGAE